MKTSMAMSAASITPSPDLARRLAAGLPLTVLGQASLSGTLSRLVVLGRSEQGRAAALSAVVTGTTRPPPVVAARFRTERRGRGLFVQDQAGADRFVLSSGLLNQLVVSAGIWPVLLPLIGPRVAALPVADAGRLAADLDLFCRVVETTVGRAGAGLRLTLEPTGTNVDSAVGSLGRLGRAAAGVVRRVPGAGRAPGHVYEPDDAGDEAISFSDIGGQEAAKIELETVCLAISDPQLFLSWGARPPRGVLLYGPPGTGKTMLARALARESGARFIHVRATDIVSKWYGEAERKLQEAFDWARRERPAVLFFDEIDALARAREDAHEASHRLVSTFLENMDGLQVPDGVIVLAATNRPEAVDEALTRPGRFDRLVEVPLPGPDGRRQVFEVHLGRASRQAGRPLFEPIDEAGWDQLMAASDGFSGAEIAEVVRRALEARIRAGDKHGQVGGDELLSVAGGVRRPW